MNPSEDKQGEVKPLREVLADRMEKQLGGDVLPSAWLLHTQDVREIIAALRAASSSSTRIKEAEDALSEASKALDSSRQWKGMGWEYLPIQPHNYKKAREAVSAYWTKREEESSAVPESGLTLEAWEEECRLSHADSGLVMLDKCKELERELAEEKRERAEVGEQFSRFMLVDHPKALEAASQSASAAQETLERVGRVLYTCEVRWPGDTVLDYVAALVTAGLARANQSSAPSSTTLTKAIDLLRDAQHELRCASGAIHRAPITETRIKEVLDEIAAFLSATGTPKGK